MTRSIKTIIYPVKDLAKAKALYCELLGVEPIMDEAYYVGFNVEGLDVGLDPHGHSKGMTGP
ncbi:MAG: VOC family protein, partial [Chloroflexota bacterium]